MKKIILYGILAAMLTSMLAFPTFAAEEATQSGIYDLAAASGYTSAVTLKAQNAGGTAVTGTAVSISGKDVTLYPDAEKVELTYSNASNGAQYLVTVLNGGEVPTNSNTVYLDQQQADGKNVTFTLYPSSLESGKEYAIYLSSSATNGLQKLTKVAGFKYYKYQAYILGDVDGNGRLQPKDALWAIQASANRRPLTDVQKLAADADQNGRLQPKDALWILQASANRRTLVKK